LPVGGVEVKLEATKSAIWFSIGGVLWKSTNFCLLLRKLSDGIIEQLLGVQA
jgi:hypothetical protein